MNVVLCIPTLSPAGAQRTRLLIEAASRGTRKPDRVYVVDNGGHFLGVVDPSWRAEHGVFTDLPGTNIGVGPAWNSALRAFAEWPVIFANDDITLHPESIDAIVRGFADGALMVATHGHGFSLFGMVPELVRRVGYFDEGFAPAYYEDTDYLRRMTLAGVERKLVTTSATHKEQSTSRDMGWNPWDLINQQAVRYDAKWGGLAGEERFEHPWGIDIEVCVPSCHTTNLQRLIDSLAWQTVRPVTVTIASNADINIDTRGLRVRQVKFWSEEYAIGDGDASLRRNVATWASEAKHIVYSDDDQVWPQNAMEWFARRFAAGEAFVVGHHRFVENIEARWCSLRNAKPDVGASRERYPNQENLWQSCWGGCVGIHSMMIKYGVGGWDMGYATSEDQQLARRIVGMGDESQIMVYEPPWAWHEKESVHAPPWTEPHGNTCTRGTHEMVADETGPDVVRCAKCPIKRRVDGTVWPTIQLFDPSKVRTETRWL